jgi:hypothetical protein
MIDDMASLKQAMEQMDAEDATVAQAGKDRAAQLLSHAGLSFTKLGELIEQQRLLLRPRIVASIKRMDQPAMLGDAAFRDSGASLRKEGQSFGQIAEALEMRGPIAPAPRYEPPVHRSVLTALQDVPDMPEVQPGLPLVLRIVLYPVRHPIQALVIAVLAVTLINGLRDFAGTGRQVSADNTARRLAEASPTPPAPVPSPSPADQSSAAPPSAGPSGTSPSASQPTPTVSASPSVPPASTPPRADTRSASPSTSGDRPRTAQLRNFENLMPARLRRSSRSAGPCRGGIGGCYWGGGQY